MTGQGPDDRSRRLTVVIGYLVGSVALAGGLAITIPLSLVVVQLLLGIAPRTPAMVLAWGLVLELIPAAIDLFAFFLAGWVVASIVRRSAVMHAFLLGLIASAGVTPIWVASWLREPVPAGGRAGLAIIAGIYVLTGVIGTTGGGMFWVWLQRRRSRAASEGGVGRVSDESTRGCQ